MFACYLVPVLLFLCCLVMSKRKKKAHSVSTADKISLYFPSMIRFLAKRRKILELPLFHKMLEGLNMRIASVHVDSRFN